MNFTLESFQAVGAVRDVAFTILSWRRRRCWTEAGMTFVIVTGANVQAGLMLARASKDNLIRHQEKLPSINK